MSAETDDTTQDRTSAWWPHLYRIQNWPVAFGLAMLWCISKIPFPYNVRLGKVIGQLLYLIPSRRKHITLTNLRLCLPELDESQRQQFCNRVFENYGAGLVETAMAWWSPSEQLHQLVELEGEDILQAARAQRKGVLLLGAHFSTLDLGAALARRYFSYSLVYKPQKNALFNSVMDAGRRQHTLNNFKNSELRQIARALKHDGIVWYAPDQDMGERNSVYAPFFGQQAATITATAKLARLSGSPVIMFGQYRKADDSGYTLRITGPLEGFPSGDDAADAGQVNALIETAVRLEPEQYYWFHRRFKNQPDQAHGALYRQ